MSTTKNKIPIKRLNLTSFYSKYKHGRISKTIRYFEKTYGGNDILPYKYCNNHMCIGT